MGRVIISRVGAFRLFQLTLLGGNMKRFCLSLFVIMSCGHVYAATDTSKPYIGSQTPDSSDGLNNGAIQGFSSWGADVTGEMGNTLCYITPRNTASAGGVWAGDKAAALTFGNAKTGIFVDGSGAKIKNSDLNLTDNKVTNLKDGVADKDAVNVSQLKKSADETLNSANSYTDGKAKETLNAANHYADGKAKETLDTATTYTDNKSREMLGTANAYTDQKIERLDKKMNRGLASTAALSGLFQPYGIGKFNLSEGGFSILVNTAAKLYAGLVANNTPIATIRNSTWNFGAGIA